MLLTARHMRIAQRMVSLLFCAMLSAATALTAQESIQTRTAQLEGHITISSPTGRTTVARGATVTIDCEACLGRLRIDSTGYYRKSDLPVGPVTLEVRCPSATSLGAVAYTQALTLAAGEHRVHDVTLQAAMCAEPKLDSVRGRFRGIYTLHWEASTFQLCDEVPPIARAVMSRHEQIQNLAVVLSTAAVRNRFARVDVLPAALDVTPLYVEWHGTLVGPGTYGAWGLAPYLIKVDRVDSLRAVQLRDCPRINRYAARAPVRFDTSAVMLAAWRAIEAVPAEVGRVRVLSVTSRVDLATVPLSPTVTAQLRDGGVAITRPVEHYGNAKREVFRVVDLEPQANGTVVAVLASAFTIPDGKVEWFGTHTVRLRVVCVARGCGATVISP